MAKKRTRTNPVDPLSVGLQATSFAYYLAVARDLSKKNKRRKNPINWAETIALGAGSAVGAIAGETLAAPLMEKARELLYGKKRKNPTLLVASNPTKRGRKNRATKKASKLKKSKLRAKNKNLVLRIERVEDHEGDPEYEAAKQMYGEFFYGDEPVEVIAVEAPEGTPKYLVSLGQAPEVTYKPADHTSKKGVPFVHRFGEEGGEPPFLATDANGDFLGYVGGTWWITPDGVRD